MAQQGHMKHRDLLAVANDLYRERRESGSCISDFRFGSLLPLNTNNVIGIVKVHDGRVKYIEIIQADGQVERVEAE